MADSNEEQMQDTTTPNNGASKQLKSQHPNSSTLAIPTLTIVIAVVGLALAAYTLFLNNELREQLANNHANMSSELNELAQEQHKIQQQAQSKNKNTEELQTQFQTQFANLSSQLQSATQQKLYQNQDWLLLKARYYLEIAQINAHWSNAPDATIALLEQADQLLKQFNDPQIFTIRQAIAKEINQLQSLPTVDIAGMLSQLDAAQQSINNLSILLPEAPGTSATKPKAAPTDNSSWNPHLQESINLLGKLVVIRRHDQEIKPLLSPELEATLKQSLRLNLQEAQWAILNHEPAVYQLVLKQAINTLQTNFNEHSSNTTALINTLSELQKISIIPAKPAKNLALPMLNELIANKKGSVEQGPTHAQEGEQP